jgi:subtilisin family serine protease
MSSLRRAAPLAALLVVAAAATATAAPSAKTTVATPAEAGARGAEIHAAGGFARVAPGARRILVTFADAPRRAEAERRLAGLGAVVPVLPEAGVWSLAPSDADTARERALRRAGVAAAEWSLLRETTELPRPAPPLPPGPPPTFTDPLLASARQWGLTPGGSTWGADLTVTGPRPRIAILDTGVDGSHEEWAGPATPLVAARSTVRRDGDATDWGLTGHGTHVAGIAAAPANGVGIVGVAPSTGGAAEIVPVQIADREGRSSDETMIRGIRHAVVNGAKVINISAGGDGYSRAFQDTVLWATQRGALIVASVGNEGDGENALNYPAAYPRVLGVGAQCDGQASPDCPSPLGVAGFSNHNRSVDVIAPGVNILSSVPKRVSERVVEPGYALKDGTSMSAPFVSGVAALVMAANPAGLSPWQVLRQIENTATDVGPRGRDVQTGSGIVNPRAAVTLLAPADDPSEVNDDVKWATGRKRLAQTGSLSVEASVDRDDDPDDVFAVQLRRGERLRVSMRYRSGRIGLFVWRPGTRTVTAGQALRSDLLRYRQGSASRKSITYRAERTGRHYVDVFAQKGSGAYTLTITRGA